MAVEKEIEADLDWRFEELDSLKRQIQSQPKNSVGQRALLRAIWTMLYAHYEGFCKNAIAIYLRELERLGVKRADCRYELRVFSLLDHCRVLQGGTSTAGHYDFMTIALNQLEGQPISFARDKKSGDYVLKGNSNLWPKLLTQNCDNVGLASRYVWENKTRLYLLVDRRNSIAHGEKLIVSTLAEYKQFEEVAVQVMMELGFAVIEAIDTQEYKGPAVDFGILGRWLKVTKSL